MSDKSLIILLLCCMVWSFGFGVWIECNYHIGHMQVSVPNWLCYAILGFLIGVTDMRIYYDLKE